MDSSTKPQAVVSLKTLGNKTEHFVNASFPLQTPHTLPYTIRWEKVKEGFEETRHSTLNLYRKGTEV